MNTRRSPGPAAGLALLALALSAFSGDDARVAVAVSEARTAADGLSATLKRMLQEELVAGGFDGAVRVCAERAQAETRTYAAGTGRAIRRVSLKHRNAANTPDPFERRVLEAFEGLPAQERAGAERFEVVREGGRETLRYMRALVTTPLCLTCHGPAERIPFAAREILTRRYPDDRAVDFAVGDVRGAISVRIDLAPGRAH
jgi:hypothetical protein